MNISEKIVQLMDSRIDGDPNAEFTEYQRGIIKDLAEVIRCTDLYLRLSDKFEKEKQALCDLTPQEIYLHMLERIASAPVGLFALSTPVLIIPMLDDKLCLIEKQKGR